MLRPITAGTVTWPTGACTTRPLAAKRCKLTPNVEPTVAAVDAGDVQAAGAQPVRHGSARPRSGAEAIPHRGGTQVVVVERIPRSAHRRGEGMQTRGVP